MEEGQRVSDSLVEKMNTVGIVTRPWKRQKCIYRDTERHHIMTLRFSFEVRTSSFMKQRERNAKLNEACS